MVWNDKAGAKSKYVPAPSAESTSGVSFGESAKSGQGATVPSRMPPPLKIKPGESLGEFAKRRAHEKKNRNVAVQRAALK